MEKETKKNQPAAKFRAGGVTATVWENELDVKGKKVKVYSVDVVRSYFDAKDKAWKTTTQMKKNDLPKLALVANKAFEFVTIHESEDDAD